MTNFTETIGRQRKTLHALLKTTSDFWLKSEVEPIIIGLYEQPSAFSKDTTISMYRFQFGTYSWQKYISTVNPQISTTPDYVKLIEEQAMILAKENWDQLSANLLPGYHDLPDDKKAKELEMFLIIEKHIAYLGVRRNNKIAKKVAYFIVGPDTLEPTEEPPNVVWFGAYPNQQHIPVFKPYSIIEKTVQSYSHDPEGTTTRNRDDVVAHIKWWYQMPLMPEREAREILGDLLKVIFERLSQLGRAVAIATSPHRFNDACGDDDWLAVFVDGHFWENGVYFESSAATLAKSPRELQEAIGLLQEVLKSQLRNKIGKYLGKESASPDTFVLSSDERGYLIAFSKSVDNGGPVFRIDETTGLPVLIGAAPRLDWRFSECTRPNGTNETDDGWDSEKGQSYVLDYVPLDNWIVQFCSGEQPNAEYPELPIFY